MSRPWKNLLSTSKLPRSCQSCITKSTQAWPNAYRSSCWRCSPPNISISGGTQPITRFSANRPPEIRSMVMAAFAATIGCKVGRWEVEATAIRSVASEMPAAQV